MNYNKIFILLSLLALVILFINFQAELINIRSKDSKRKIILDIDPALEMEYNKLSNGSYSDEVDVSNKSFDSTEWSSESEFSDDSDITFP